MKGCLQRPLECVAACFRARTRFQGAGKVEACRIDRASHSYDGYFSAYILDKHIEWSSEHCGPALGSASQSPLSCGEQIFYPSVVARP